MGEGRIEKGGLQRNDSSHSHTKFSLSSLNLVTSSLEREVSDRSFSTILYTVPCIPFPPPSHHPDLEFEKEKKRKKGREARIHFGKVLVYYYQTFKTFLRVCFPF